MKCVKTILIIVAGVAVTAGSALATDYYWAQALGGNWNDPANWSPDTGVPGADDRAFIQYDGGYTVTLDVNATVRSWEIGGGLGGQILNTNGYNLTNTESSTVNGDGKLYVNGGTLTGTGNIDVFGQLEWLQGTILGVGDLNFQSGAQVDLSSTYNWFLAEKVLNNYGDVSLTGSGTLYLYNGAQIYNHSGASWVAVGSGNLTIQHWTGANVAFDNSGLLRQNSANTLSFYGNGLTLSHNSGATLDIDAGMVALNSTATLASTCNLEPSTTLEFGSFAQTLSSGTVIQGAGIARLVSGTVTISDTVLVDHWQQTGGILDGDGLLWVVEDYAWSIGTQQGTGITYIPPSAELQLSSSNNKFLFYRVLEVEGTLNHLQGNLYLGYGAIINNRATAVFELATGSAVYHYTGDLSSLNNYGLFRKGSGSGTSYVQSLNFNNLAGTVEVVEGDLLMDYSVNLQGGTVTVASTAVYQMYSGNFSVSNNARFIGAGFTRLVSATTTVSDTMFVAKMQQTGGILQGDGVLLVEESFDWSNGTQQGVGTTNIAPMAELVLTANNNKFLFYRTLENRGNCFHNLGILYLGYGATVNNQALYELGNGCAIYQYTGAISNFNNYGLFRKGIGAGTSYAQGHIFTNWDATVEVLEGTLLMDYDVRFQGGIATTAPGAIYQMSSGGFNVSGNARFNGDGSTVISSATVTVSDTMFAAHLVQNGGYLQGDGVLQIEQDFNWNSGYQQGAGTTFIPATAELNLASTGNKYLYTRTVNNYGSCDHSGGVFYLGNAAHFNNQPGAEYLIQDARQITHHTGDYSYFDNYGTFRKGSGNGTSYVQTINFSSFADLVVDEGTLSMDFLVTLQGGVTTTLAGARYLMASGTFNVSNNARFAGSGTTEITGAYVNTSDTMFVDHLVQSGGYLQGAGVLWIEEDFNWISGYQQGTGSTVIPSGSQLWLTSTGGKYLYERILENWGSCSHNSGHFLLGNSAVFNNQPGAQYLLSDGRYLLHNTGATSAFNNYGTFRKEVGTGTSYVQSLNFSNWNADLVVDEGTLSMDFLVTLQGGTTTTPTGARYLMSSGTFNISNNARFTGSGTTEITGAYVNTSDTMFVDHLVQSGGYLEGDGVLYIGETFDWLTGYQRGIGTTVIAVGSQLNLLTGSNKYINYRTLENLADCYHTAGNIYLGDGAVINNQPGAFYELTDSRYIAHYVGDIGTFNNYGLLSKAGGTGTAYIQGLYLNNLAGNLEVTAGTLHLDYWGNFQGGNTNTLGGANLKLNSGNFYSSNNAAFTGAGTVEIAGAVVAVTDTMFVEHLLQTGGFQEGEGVVCITDDFDWRIGTLRGTGKLLIPFGSDLSLTTGSSKYVISHRIDIFGNCDHLTGVLYLAEDPLLSIHPGGVYDLADNSSINYWYGVTGSIENSGLLHKSTGGGTATINSLPVNNSGVLSADTGTLRLASCQLDNLNGGTLAGNGTIDLATAAGFVQAGSIAPGVSPGILYLTGSLPSESTSVLALEFAGTTVGDDYDQLAVSGTAHLDGIITPIMLNDFLPDPGTVFTVMTHGGHSGFFQESIITINDSLYFTIDYEATEVLLVARKLGIPILEITYEGGVLLLNWNIVEEAQYYNVYQLDGPHGEPVLLTQTTATEYDATGLLTEGRLFFQVTSEGVDATSAAAARQAARWRAGNRN